MKKFAIACHFSASVSLIVDGLSPSTRDRIDIFSPNEDEDKIDAYLDNAAVVLIVRDLHQPSFRQMARRCQKRGIPFYFYTDDNFWVLADAYPELAWFGTDEARALIAEAAGVVVSSDALQDFILRNGFHQNVFRCSPVLMPDLIPPAAKKKPWWSKLSKKQELVAAYSGGGFRDASLRQFAGPALQEISKTTSTKLLVRAGNPLGTNGRVTVEEAGFDPDFRQFILKWRAHAPQVVLHPRGDTPNAAYKTANVLLVSYLLGAIPIVSHEAAYADVGEESGVLRAGDDPAEWGKAMRRLIEPDARLELFHKLAARCLQEFSPTMNTNLIAELLNPINQPVR